MLALANIWKFWGVVGGFSQPLQHFLYWDVYLPAVCHFNIDARMHTQHD